MPAGKTTDSIIHEVNVSQSIDCNPRARYHISKQCIILENESKIKWNELGYWLNSNPNATIAHVHLIRQMLENGDDVRGFEIPKTFCTVQSDLLKHNGKTFTILREITGEEADLFDVGKMYKIQLSSGEIVRAFEDEIMK